MGFDAEGYRKAAKAAGISDEDIERDIAEETRGAAPVNKPLSKEDVQIGGQYDWLMPAAAATGIGLGATGLGIAAKSIKDRWINKSPEMPRIEPTMDESRYAGPGRIEPTMEPTATEKPPKSPYSPAEQEMITRSEQNRFAKQAEAASQAAGAVPGSVKPASPVVQAPVAPVAPAVPATPSVAQVAAETAPTVAPTLAQITQQVAPSAPVAPPVAPTAPETTEAKNKGGRPKGSKPLADTPESWQKLTKEGTTFLPGYGPGDNNLYNTYGPEGRRAILERYNEGKPIGSYENYLKLNEKLKLGVPASEVPGLMARLPSEEEAGNYSKLGKAAKIAGVGGLLVGAANLANAKTPGQLGLAGSNLFEAILPPGANINEAGAPVLPPSVLAAQKRQLEEMQKLGSPYRTR